MTHCRTESCHKEHNWCPAKELREEPNCEWSDDVGQKENRVEHGVGGWRNVCIIFELLLERAEGVSGVVVCCVCVQERVEDEVGH
jgi:hypothetical protein